MSNELLIRYLARAVQSVKDAENAMGQAQARRDDMHQHGNAIARKEEAVRQLKVVEQAIVRGTTEPGAIEFVETLLEGFRHNNDRQLYVVIDQSWGSQKVDDVNIRFINLPPRIGAAGGGAEAENNRMSFWVKGFSSDNAPPPTGKVKINMSTSSLPRTHTLRAKSGAPLAIAKYLADFLNKVVAEVPPLFTHTR